MEKIIAKIIIEKAMDWVEKNNAIMVRKIEYEDCITEYYASTGGDAGSDFDILVVNYHNDNEEDAMLYTFKDMDIDKYLSDYPHPYDFYDWMEMNQDHVDAESYSHWIEGNHYDDYFFSLYVDYLLYQKQQGTVEYTSKRFEDDYKEITLAESIKNSFADVFDKDVWDKVLSDAFHTENSGQGVWLVRSDSSFYENGYSIPIRTDNIAYIIMVNSNIWQKVISHVKSEGFSLWTGKVYGSGGVYGERVTLY